MCVYSEYQGHEVTTGRDPHFQRMMSPLGSGAGWDRGWGEHHPKCTNIIGENGFSASVLALTKTFVSLKGTASRILIPVRQSWHGCVILLPIQAKLTSCWLSLHLQQTDMRLFQSFSCSDKRADD